MKIESIRKHPLYNRWHSMVKRCHDPNNKSYQYYGAKGITVCDRWRYSFECFVFDVDYLMENGERLYLPDYCIDKDFKGGKEYSLDNCTAMTNKKNRFGVNTKAVLVEKDNIETHFNSLAEVRKELGIHRHTIARSMKNDRRTKDGYKFRWA